ncbi:MAG: GTPase HflX [Paludibacteraceae bacterium]|jgi:GTP-binding protein HflX|nr:GTPase HflX [Paludibacteraceae bacterium]MBQ2050829.1 GTPase HflX [Paludibacteraceae bacterium]MBQ2590234.1 GTPase HflX [Paludibacteraceae bacterium]MBR2178442.1 GTPase HflX [Paludibacteraceae bacterium]
MNRETEELLNTADKRAVMVGLVTPNQSEERTKEYLDELAFLAETSEIVPEKRFIQAVQTPHSQTYVGQGKLEEIKQYIDDNGIEIAIFDDELSPRQLRNIEKKLCIQVLDRTSLILDIFAQRAQTSYAKTQVEMAQLQYMLPRLTRMWSHLDRQRGGGTTSRGMGETQIEADKRIIQSRISLLREDLKRIDKQMETQRRNRGKMVRVALVGYTNVGKSTLMNLLCKTNVFAENKLFATLDTTVRKMTIENLPFLLCDTVGFIRKLPHNLVESFKSTLDEVREADVLLHVVDISHPNFEEQIEVVNSTLAELGAGDKPTIMVFNKIDSFSYVPKEENDLTPIKRENISLAELKKTWMANMNDNCMFISAKERNNIDELKVLMYKHIRAVHVQRFPYNDFLYPDIARTGGEDEL